MTEQLINLATSVLNAPMTNSSSAASVQTVSKFPGSGNFRIRVDNELMLVGTPGATLAGLTRGVEGTTAAAHLSGAIVEQVLTVAGLDLRIQEIVAANMRGQANGVASLVGGVVPGSQLPASVVEYKGAWNASTNTPTLSDATGTLGDEYVVSVGGARNLGSGSITWAANDLAIHNGSIWQQVAGASGVAGVSSVNTRTGAVTLVKGDVGLGSVDNTADSAKPVSTAQQNALNLKADTSDLQVAGPLDSVAAHGSPYTPVTADGGKVFVMGASANQVFILPASGLPESFVVEFQNTTTAFRFELRSVSGSLIESVLSAARVGSVWVEAPWGTARARFRAAGFWSVSGDLSLTATP